MAEDALRRAIEYFEKALEKDPNCALAYAGLAGAYTNLGYVSTQPPKEIYPIARQAAVRALQLDDTIASAQLALAHIKMMFDWDWEGAEEEYKSLLEVNPGYANAHSSYAFCLAIMGRHDEAIKEIKIAVALDPLSLIINRTLGQIYFLAHKYDKGIEALKNTLEMDPSFDRTHSFLGIAYVGKGMYDDALAEFEKENELMQRWHPINDVWIGITCSLMGKKERGEKILRELIKRSKDVYIPPVFLAELCLALGHREEFSKWLNKAYEERDSLLPSLTGIPMATFARSDPTLVKMLKKIGLDP
jgi:tetratricopeptide (TPR) repeat protein